MGERGGGGGGGVLDGSDGENCSCFISVFICLSSSLSSGGEVGGVSKAGDGEEGVGGLRFGGGWGGVLLGGGCGGHCGWLCGVGALPECELVAPVVVSAGLHSAPPCLAPSAAPGFPQGAPVCRPPVSVGGTGGGLFGGGGGCRFSDSCKW